MEVKSRKIRQSNHFYGKKDLPKVSVFNFVFTLCKLLFFIDTATVDTWTTLTFELGQKCFVCLYVLGHDRTHPLSFLFTDVILHALDI